MDKDSLKQALTDLSLRQATLARLLGVTPRAVTLWLAGERSVPTPVASYLRLFKLLPPSLRQAELANAAGEGRRMREGMYGITFQSSEGEGVAVLVFENGRIYGADSRSVTYDGSYTFDPVAGLVDAVIKITFPPDVMSVFGVSNPYEWSFDVNTKFDPEPGSGNMEVKSSLGDEIDAQFIYLRKLPTAL